MGAYLFIEVICVCYKEISNISFQCTTNQQWHRQVITFNSMIIFVTEEA